LDVNSVRCTADVRPVFSFCPHTVQVSGVKLLIAASLLSFYDYIPNFISILIFLNVAPQKSHGLRSGARGGQMIGPSLAVRLCENWSFNASRTTQLD
jgi:hypothetical protein